MNTEKFEDYCRSLKGVTQSELNANGQHTNLTAYETNGKRFVVVDSEKHFADIKADPAVIAEMLQKYEGATTAKYEDKKHWLGLNLDMNVPGNMTEALVDAAYDLVAN